MPRIKIKNLPKNTTVNQKIMKQVLGGNQMNSTTDYTPPEYNPDTNKMIIQGYDVYDRMTRGANSKTWGESSESYIIYVKPS